MLLNIMVWKCMDTIRDKQVIEEILRKKKMKLFITGSNGYIARNFIKKQLKKNIRFLLLHEKIIKKSKMSRG